MAGAGDLIPILPEGSDHVGNFSNIPNYYSPPKLDGLDLALFPQTLGKQLDKLAKAMLDTAQNQNMTDQDRAVAMQSLAGAWSVTAMIQTQGTDMVLKALQQIAHNISG